MTKNEFLKKLSRELSPVKNDERQKSLNYYSEIIDDRIESGLSEAQAVDELEDTSAIAKGIIDEAREQGDLKPKNKPISTTLLIVGSPLWIVLMAAFIAVIIAMYVVVWSIIIALFAVDFSFAIVGPASIVYFVVHIASNSASAFAVLGMGLVCAALAIFIFFPILKLTKWLITRTASVCKKSWNKITRKDNI